MSSRRTRLALLALVSVFATAVVLAGADGSQSSRASLAAAIQRVAAARAAATQPATTPTPVQPPRPTVAASPNVAPAPVADAPVPAASSASTPVRTATRPAPPAVRAKPKAAPSKVGHLFVIALSGAGYQQTFGGQSALPYLATQLRPQGAVLSGFHPLDASELPNYLAFAGGIAPNAATRANCSTFADGDCVQPNTTLSLGDQVTASGRSWKAYLEGMGDAPCRHPDDGAADTTVQSAPDGYVTRHNPFVYFHSLLDLGDCIADDVDLRGLADDLKAQRTTPNLAFIAPAAASDPDAFLQTWVPQIQASKAYSKDGAIAIVFLSGAQGTEPTGALVLSRFVRAGSLYARPYDPLALLRTTEDLFALDPLGKAKGASSFAKSVFTSAFAGD